MEKEVSNYTEVPLYVYEEWDLIQYIFSFISHVSRNIFEVDTVITCTSQEIIDYYNELSTDDYYDIFYQDFIDSLFLFREGTSYDYIRKRWTIYPYILLDELYEEYIQYIPYIEKQFTE
jgi:hypothetical protein